MTRPRPPSASDCSSAKAWAMWAQVLDDFVMAEDLGFDHAWLVDHLIDTDGTPRTGASRAGPCFPRSRRRPSASVSACS